MKRIRDFINDNFRGIIFILSLLIIVLTFLSYILNDSFGIGQKYELNTDKLGHFGDFVGGFLGTILTIIATIYIYQTFNAQKKSIQIQETQLINQKEELESQRQLIAQQQFESTFFNMLNVHNELKKELISTKFILENAYVSGSEYFVNKEKVKGIEAIEEVNNHFISYYYKITNRKNFIYDILPDNKFKVRDFKLESDLKEFEKIKLKDSEIAVINFIYGKIFDKFQDEISHYCRNVYTILKFIRKNEEDLGKNTKMIFRDYADIFQSQLNINEQFLLFYNFIYFNDEEKGIYSTINLVNHYKFLENLGHKNLFDNNLHNNNKFYNFEIK